MSWTNAQTALNGPPGKVGGRLEVVSVQNGVRQIFHNYGEYDNGLRVYFRNYYASNDEWFDWHALADDSQITSLNSTVTNKADKNHTHSSLSGGVSYRQVDNDYDGLPVYCSIKNGFAFLTWNNPFQYLNSNGSIKQTGVYFQIGYVAAPDIDEGSIYRLGSNWRLKINKEGKLEGFVDIKDAWTYGTWVYPTSSTSLPYPDD